MRRVVLCSVLLVLALAAPAAAAGDIAVEGFSFVPSTITRTAGATVTWSNAGGAPHNVASVNTMFSKSATGFTTFQRTFSAGTFGYRCEIHSDSMTGQVRVKPRLAASPDGRPFTVRWATASTNTATSYRVEYRIGTGTWRVWRSNTTTRYGVFGRDGAPVTVRSGTRYSLRVRSRRGERLSAYSPAVAFTP